MVVDLQNVEDLKALKRLSFEELYGNAVTVVCREVTKAHVILKVCSRVKVLEKVCNLQVYAKQLLPKYHWWLATGNFLCAFSKERHTIWVWHLRSSLQVLLKEAHCSAWLQMLKPSTDCIAHNWTRVQHEIDVKVAPSLACQRWLNKLDTGSTLCKDSWSCTNNAESAQWVDTVCCAKQ